MKLVCALLLLMATDKMDKVEEVRENVERLGGEIKDIQTPDGRYFEINLAGTAATDTDIMKLRGLPGYVRLDLKRTKITDVALGAMKDMDIITLGLEATMVSDAGMEAVGKLEKLENLGLNETKISDTGVARLKSCRQLRYLYLAKTKVTSKCLPVLSDLPRLEDVNLQRTKVSEADIKAADLEAVVVKYPLD